MSWFVDCLESPSKDKECEQFDRSDSGVRHQRSDEGLAGCMSASSSTTYAMDPMSVHLCRLVAVDSLPLLDCRLVQNSIFSEQEV
jgi:hypothetical protein